LENYRIFKISNFKLNYRKEELNYEKADKSSSQSAFRIELQKNSFSKST
jgi:hypothetical protein